MPILRVAGILSCFMEHRREQKRIALRLLELRSAHGLSQEDLAEVLAIGQSAYSELESAHVKLSAERAIKLAGLYRMSVDDLLLGTGTGNREQGTGNREPMKAEVTLIFASLACGGQATLTAR